MFYGLSIKTVIAKCAFACHFERMVETCRDRRSRLSILTNRFYLYNRLRARTVEDACPNNARTSPRKNGTPDVTVGGVFYEKMSFYYMHLFRQNRINILGNGDVVGNGKGNLRGNNFILYNVVNGCG